MKSDLRQCLQLIKADNKARTSQILKHLLERPERCFYNVLSKRCSNQWEVDFSHWKTILATKKKMMSATKKVISAIYGHRKVYLSHCTNDFGHQKSVFDQSKVMSSTQNWCEKGIFATEKVILVNNKKINLGHWKSDLRHSKRKSRPLIKWSWP